MMACARKPSVVKLIVGIIFTSEGVLIKAKQRLKKRFGPFDFESSFIPFHYTEYYEKEMGSKLKRQFLSFRWLIQPEKLAEIKLYTNRLEKQFSRSKDRPSRMINLDPGYISAAKLILATCKDYVHRIYLDKGVFAEATLRFQDGSFKPWPWTYPDYRSKDYIQNFNVIRKIYLRQLWDNIS
jgi:hypothetical protein